MEHTEILANIFSADLSTHHGTTVYDKHCSILYWNESSWIKVEVEKNCLMAICQVSQNNFVQATILKQQIDQRTHSMVHLNKLTQFDDDNYQR